MGLPPTGRQGAAAPGYPCALDRPERDLETPLRRVTGQRILGVVRVTDAPADGQGRTYVIERELTSKAELVALVAHYVQQAQRWDDVPLLHLYPDKGEDA